MNVFLYRVNGLQARKSAAKTRPRQWTGARVDVRTRGGRMRALLPDGTTGGARQKDSGREEIVKGETHCKQVKGQVKDRQAKGI